MAATEKTMPTMIDVARSVAEMSEGERFAKLAQHVLNKLQSSLILHATLFPDELKDTKQDFTGTFDRHDLDVPWNCKYLCRWNTTFGYESWNEQWVRFVDFLQPIALAQHNILLSLPEPNSTALLHFQYPPTTPPSTPSSPPSPRSSSSASSSSPPPTATSIATAPTVAAATEATTAATTIDSTSLKEK